MIILSSKDIDKYFGYNLILNYNFQNNITTFYIFK